MEIIVFTNTGKTYNFKNVTNLIPTTQGFEFDYTGVATGVTTYCIQLHERCRLRNRLVLIDREE